MDHKSYLSKSRYPLWRLLSYLRGYRRDCVLACLYSMLNKLFDIFPEILLGVAVNMVVSQQNSWIAQLTGKSSLFFQLLCLGALTFVIWALESCFQYLYSLKWRNLAQAVEHQLRLDVYAHIQKAQVKTIESTSVGQLVSTVNDDINQMERFLEDGVNQIIQITVSTLFIGLVFLFASPLITLLAIVPIPFVVMGAFYFQHRLAPRFLDVRQKAAEISGALQSNLLGLVTIKSYNAESHEERRIGKKSQAYKSANQRTIEISAMVTPVIRMFVLTGFLFTLLIGGHKTFQGQMNVGVFSMLIFLSQRLLWPFNQLAELTVDYQRVMASTTRVLNLLTWQTEHDGPVSVKPSTVSDQQSIFVRNVHFGYSEAQALYQDFSVTIPAAQTTAFVGESGSGKSTLIKLLCRFYTPQQGGLYFGDQSIDKFDLSFWRQQIALVTQDSFLFSGSIEENILYGSFDQSHCAAVAAAQAAGLHEFIMQLPHQYATQVGESGVLLSGGQKQRISIARAIVKNAPILILDEATSAVDNETELAIQRALIGLAKEKTTILIAHRLSTVRHADVIHVMQRGAIIESGSHEQLLQQQGQYHKLWNIQTGNVS